MRVSRSICALLIVVLSLLVLAGPGALHPTSTHADDTSTVRAAVTWYPISGATACNGYTYHGSAACSYNLPCGTIVHFADRTVTCNDRGDLYCWKYNRICDYWIDIYQQPDVEYTYGLYADIWFEFP